ncbi:MAG: shikimate dehydrogenase [Chthoniobacterales bacterium]
MKPLHLGVIGYPINQSLSPLMQSAALQAMQFPFDYIAMEVKPEELESTLRVLPEKKFLGINITLPHKQRALSLMHDVSEHARFLGAINTVIVHDKKLHGCNTDGPGFVKAVKEDFGIEVKNLHVLVLGANGGAGRAIAAQCILEGSPRITLAGRNEEGIRQQAEYLSRHLPPTNPHTHIQTTSLEINSLARVMRDVDLIVNATSVGMNKNDPSLLPSLLFHSGQFLYDTIYFSHKTPLMQAASNAGAHSANGLSMLLHQGALAFELWFEQPAPVNVMREALKHACTLY